jgi:hypothetical protein
MIFMAGKRLAAAGVLVAAVAATAALWVAPQTTLAAQLRAGQPRPGQLGSIRQAQSMVTMATGAHLRAVVALPAQEFPAGSPVLGLTAAGVALFALALVGTALRPRHRAVTVPARSPHRGRAPPSRVAHHHPARIRDH